MTIRRFQRLVLMRGAGAGDKPVQDESGWLDTGTLHFHSDAGATNKLQRFVRWAIDTTGADWSVCFAFDVGLKD